MAYGKLNMEIQFLYCPKNSALMSTIVNRCDTINLLQIIYKSCFNLINKVNNGKPDSFQKK